MNYYLAIAMGGAAGAMSRYWLHSVIEGFNSSNFPLGTFMVNVAGSVLIGIFFVVFAEKVHFDAQWRPIVIIGFLGGMTTFSAFSLEGLLLLQQGHYTTALFYIFTSVAVCLLAVFTGMQIMRLLL